jgi:DNA-binding PadR family transcriptional regulator
MFEILLSLAGGERHGYAIMREVEERTRGEVSLGPATLYRSIRKLLRLGYIEASREDGDPEESERRRYYRILEAGRQAAAVRAESLAKSVEVARSRDLLAESGTS